jgi:hypothetical protein
MNWSKFVVLAAVWVKSDRLFTNRVADLKNVRNGSMAAVPTKLGVRPVYRFFDGKSEREQFSKFRPMRATIWSRASAQDDADRTNPTIRGNRREKIEGVARSLISNIVDVRDPVPIARDQIARRAEAMVAQRSVSLAAPDPGIHLG